MLYVIDVLSNSVSYCLMQTHLSALTAASQRLANFEDNDMLTENQVIDRFTDRFLQSVHPTRGSARFVIWERSARGLGTLGLRVCERSPRSASFWIMHAQRTSESVIPSR